MKSDKKIQNMACYQLYEYILSNEKYIGDSLVQKRYTPDELPLRQRRNKGEVSQYYIKDSHPAIIAKEIYEAVQELLQQRIEQHAPKQKIRKSPLSNTMQCGLCGSAFHKHKSNDENCWFCYQHRKGKTLCPMGILYEKDIYAAFLSVHNKLLDNQDILKCHAEPAIRVANKGHVYKDSDIVELNEKILNSLSRIIHSQGCRPRGALILLFL